MSHVVCVVEAAPRATHFVWSDGTGSFPPYHLAGPRLELCREAAAQSRKHLDQMAHDYLAWVNAAGGPEKRAAAAELRWTCYELARAGHTLYEWLFRPGEDEARARRTRTWLEQLRDGGEVESLELVLDGDPGIPWTAVYDQPPREAVFKREGDGPEPWQPFWGIRYNLGAGRKVDPLRRVLAPAEPAVLLVVDPHILQGLPAEQKRRLFDFARSHGNLPLIPSRPRLKEALAAGRPDLLYWLSHATPEALELDGEPIAPLELFELLEGGDSGDSGRFPGLVFLNACRTAEARPGGSSFLSALYEARCGGVIATEQQTVDTFASAMGLDFLEGFLDRGEPVGLVLQRLRAAGMPMGLVYGTYCPPRLCKRKGTRSPGAAKESGAAPVLLAAEEGLAVVPVEAGAATGPARARSVALDAAGASPPSPSPPPPPPPPAPTPR